MNKIKPLTLEETKLKEEMKARCLNGGQYKDVNAKKKFNVLCHLEDFEIQYWKLEQENQASEQTINELSNQIAKLVEENKELKSELKASNKGLQEVSTRSLKYKTKYFNSEHIIDELEKYLENEINDWKDIEDTLTRGMVQEDRNILNKLQELKGSDNNE